MSDKRIILTRDDLADLLTLAALLTGPGIRIDNGDIATLKTPLNDRLQTALQVWRSLTAGETCTFGIEGPSMRELLADYERQETSHDH